MQQELWAEIRRLCLREGLSQREVARRLRIDRGTVKRALKSESPPRHKAKKRGSRIDSFKGQIRELIQQYPKLSAIRVLEEIKKFGFKGSLTLVRNYLRRIRPPKKEAFLRIETLPAEYAQVDWGNCGKIMVEGTLRKLSCFVMVLSYSRLMYLEFTISQRIEDFINCHINAFKFFGGVPCKILYDNVRTVVLCRIQDRFQFNPKFMEFVGVYLFQIRLARLYRATDKGKVESGIKYVKRNFLAGREFRGFDDINAQSITWRDNTANVRVHGTTRQKPIDRFQQEKDKLKPLPDKPYPIAIILPCKSSSDCRIKFDGNIYSVPGWCADKTLTIKATVGQVSIYNKTKLIATHKRSYAKGKVIEDPKDVRELLKKKKKAISSKIIAEFISLGKEAKQYLEGLLLREANLAREIAKILKLRHRYGRTEVLGAIIKALEFQAFGASYIENIIVASRKTRGEPLMGGEIHIPEKFADAEYNEKDPSIYDILLNEDERGDNVEG